MTPKFNSNDFHFRPTNMGAALLSAGLLAKPVMKREPKVEVIRPNGRHEVVSIPVSNKVAGAFGKVIKSKIISDTSIMEAALRRGEATFAA